MIYKQLDIENNWGKNIFKVDGQELDLPELNKPSIRKFKCLVDNKRTRVEVETKMRLSIGHTQIHDHGHSYDQSFLKLEILVDVYGIDVWLNIEDLMKKGATVLVSENFKLTTRTKKKPLVKASKGLPKSRGGSKR